MNRAYNIYIRGSVLFGAGNSILGATIAWKDFKNQKVIPLPLAITTYGVLGFGIGMSSWLLFPISIPYFGYSIYTSTLPTYHKFSSPKV
jgi:hypothetical protein